MKTQHPCGRHAQQQTCHCACGQQPERSSQGRLQYLFTPRTQSDANAKFAQPLAYRIGGHAKDARYRQHRAEHAQNS